MELKEFLEELSDTKQAVMYSKLAWLSGLAGDDLHMLEAAWRSVPRDRKREILAKLIELDEFNLELDFTCVFGVSLEDEDAYVRETATRGLWDCEDRSMIRPLIDRLNNDDSAMVRAAAAMTLGRFAAMAHDGKLLSRDANRVHDNLMTAIGREDEDQDVRRRAIEAVAHFNTPEIRQIILEAYNSGDLRLVQSSIFAMGQSSDSRWLPDVLNMIDNERPEIRYEAAHAAGLLGDVSTAPYLIKLIEDDDPEVQLAAVKSLGILGGPLVKRTLEQVSQTQDESLQEAALEALDNIQFDEDPLGFRLDVN